METTPISKLPPGLIERFRETAIENLSELLDDMFNSADDSLFAMAEKASNNQNQTLYFDTMRALRLERPNISDRFVDQMQQSLQDPDFAKDISPEIEEDELQLQAFDQLEETVAFANMAAKAAGQFRGEITDLQARIKWLVESQGAELIEEGLSPANIIHAFKLTMEPVQFDIDIKLLIYKLFDQKVMSRLDTAYQTMNAMLIKQNVLPKIIRNKRKVMIKAAVEKLTGNSESSGEVSEPMPQGSYADSQYAGQSYGQAVYARPGATTGAVSGGADAYAAGPAPQRTTGFISALDTIESSGITQDPQAILRSGGIMSLLTQQLAHTGHAVPATNQTSQAQTLWQPGMGLSAPQAAAATTPLNTADQRYPDLDNLDEVSAVEVVSDLFIDLLKDSNITDIAKALLAKVQVPVIKAALSDTNFFKQPNHPARTLINEIAGLGALIGDTRSGLYHQMTDIVQDFVTNYKQGPGVFEETVGKLQKLSEEEAERFMQEEKELARARKDKLIAKAKERVIHRLRLATLGKYIPEEAKAFLIRAWAPYMASQFIHCGHESREWKAACDILDRAVALLQKTNADADSQSIDQLLTGISHCMSRFKGKPADLERMMAAFESALRAGGLSNQDDTEVDSEDSAVPVAINTSSIVEDLMPPAREASADATENKPTNPGRSGAEKGADKPTINPVGLSDSYHSSVGEAAEHRLLDTLLRPGAWFRLQDPDDKHLHWVRLSEYDSEQGYVVFHGSSGRTVVRNATSVSRDLLSGDCRPVMDNAQFNIILKSALSEEQRVSL